MKENHNIVQLPVRMDEYLMSLQSIPRIEVPVRMGILGCSGIVPRAILEPSAHVSTIEIAGAANRTYDKARQMADQYGIPTVYNSLDELLADEQLDAVYIGLGNRLHAPWIRRALAAGKHVLVEKPLCLDPAELDGLEETARRSGVHLTEGIMIAHHPWQQELRSCIQSSQYGELQRIQTRITIPARDGHAGNYRSQPQQGGGCFWDLGCYWLQFLQAITGIEQAQFEGKSDFDGPNGCDWTFEAQARLQNGIIADAIFSFEQPYASKHILHFEHATLTINDFFRCNLGFYRIKFKVALLQNGAGTGEVHQHVFDPVNYYVNQLRFFSDVVRGQQTNLPFAESAERIRLLSSIYATARNRMMMPEL
ncbi:Gfo/Idh/MocA family protein [Paenibacillus dauci]|uniref:Gfo/Idh/MocA family protein n=1 Tax=Paenibacillus dauci TaxID=1567106 RepID=UPI0009E5938A|nr:Gfo/Idh/MocA family oxidoreductase [Paenibacillus dauci]